MYTDPSGEWWIAFAIYGAWNLGVKAGVAAENAGGDFWKDGFWKGAIVGFAAGALGGSGIAPLGTEWLGTTLWGAGLGTATQAGTIWAMGGDDYSKIWQGALIGGAAGFMASEQVGNWSKGKGFNNDQTVFEDFKSGIYTEDGGVWQQEYLDYRGFEGRYIDEEGMSSFRIKDSEIVYRKGSFNSMQDVESSHLKESFHANRFRKSGYEGFELGNEGSFGIDRWPEERAGAIHVYKNQGLIGPGDYFSAIKESEKWINSFNLYGEYNPPYVFKPFQQKWWHRVYKTPRLW